MGECFPYKEEVKGSNPFTRTVCEADVDDALDCGSRDSGFESHHTPKYQKYKKIVDKWLFCCYTIINYFERCEYYGKK